ncbi:MAG: OmpA family protein [Rhizobiaceae bacterium]|nr:OmpA family protein [Rhizobiaceae bacterium]
MKKLFSITAPLAFIAAVFSFNAAHSQNLSSGDILKALVPQQQKTTSKTRSFSATRSLAAPQKDNSKSALDTDDRGFIQSLGATRAIKVEQREKLIAIIEESELPSVNIRILFAYDSDRIEGSSFGDLNEIGEALLDPSLANSRIMLNGHTDASGSRAYNQELSERRALSVKRYLTQKMFVPAEQLIVAGFGEDRLRNSDDPNNGINRRVEIVNLGE